MHQPLLIFTDLDGSLLDHHSYSYAPAIPTLQQLEKLKVPIIPTTSKTYEELLCLRKELNNQHPFIVENGAAIYVPKGYFQTAPPKHHLVSSYEKDEFDCYVFSKCRETWQSLLQHLSRFFPDEFITFSQLGPSGIQSSTGLSSADAEKANSREFSEPLIWKSTEQRKQAFIAMLIESGANVLQGGRFLNVTGNCDKGQALKWLSEYYKKEKKNDELISIAAGDSQNDVAMLDAADKAIIIRSPVAPSPLIRNPNKYQTQATGPEGWTEGIKYFTNLRSESTTTHTPDLYSKR